MAEIEASDGVLLYAESHGAADVSGCTILFSPAYCTTHENWRGQVDPLVAAGHRVLLWDYRGHGRSGVPKEAAAYTMDQVVDDLGRILDWGCPDAQVVLAGLSFGGLASLHFSIRHPERVRGLVLANSGPGFKNQEAAADWLARSRRTADFIESRGWAAFVGGKAGATCVGRRPELPAARAAARAIEAQSTQGVAHFGRHVAGLAPSAIDELAGIEIPALVVVGEEDPGYRRAAEVMAAKLPKARFEIVPAAGHIVNIEEPEAFDRLLLGFLAELA